MRLRLDFLAIFAVITVVVVSTATVIAQGEMRYRGGSHASGYGMHGGSGGAPIRVPGIQKNPLTQSQNEHIAQIRRNTQMRVQSTRSERNLSASERQQKIEQIRREGHERVMDVLTDDQRREFHSWWASRRDSRMGVGGHMMRGGRAGSTDPPSGKSVFDNSCAVCHGKDGNKIANWRSKVQKMSSAQVEQQVRSGSKGMPAFAKTLSGQQITQVSSYAKQLAGSGH